MARKRKHHKRTHRRRRSMGAVAKGAATNAVGVIAGAIAGRYVAKILPFGDERIKNGVVLAAGIFFPQLMKNDFGKAVGTGMVAAGGAGLIGNFVPALAGTDDTMEIPVTVGEIPDRLSVIAGDNTVMAGDDLSVLAGMEESEDMY